ncbi:MAG: type VI secretion system contractile sheath large subunit [Pseudomonadota bacterium]
MATRLQFGILNKPVPPRSGATRAFVIYMLGDFAGQASQSPPSQPVVPQPLLSLSERKAFALSFETLDDQLARLSPTLSVLGGALRLGELEDFHPDQLWQTLPLFDRLREIRRQLASPATFAQAHEALSSMGEPPDQAASSPPRSPRRRPRRSRSTAVPVRGKNGEFAALLHRESSRTSSGPSHPQGFAADEVIHKILASYLPAGLPDEAAALRAQVDALASPLMRAALHDPDMQALEALWRGADFLIRRTEVPIYGLHLTAEELAADLDQDRPLEDSGLYHLLVERPALDTAVPPPAVILAPYDFVPTPPHLALLGRAAKIAQAAGAPFITGMDVRAVEDLPDLSKQAWEELRNLAQADYLGLAVSRFLLRQPYGARSDPIDAFDFEEFTKQDGWQGLLWGHPAIAVGALLAATYTQFGAAMPLGKVLSLGELPVPVYYDDAGSAQGVGGAGGVGGTGESVALLSVQSLFPERRMSAATAKGLMPLVARRGEGVLRIPGLRGVTGAPLAGFWPDPATATTQATAQATAQDGPAPPPQKTEAALKRLDDTPDDTLSDGENGAAQASQDDDLDSLLASMDIDSEDSAGGDAGDASEASGESDDMDPELAALLADL